MNVGRVQIICLITLVSAAYTPRWLHLMGLDAQVLWHRSWSHEKRRSEPMSQSKRLALDLDTDAVVRTTWPSCEAEQQPTGGFRERVKVRYVIGSPRPQLTAQNIRGSNVGIRKK